jgi:hypothetical protein
MKSGRETRQRAGHPPRLAHAGRGTGRQGPRCGRLAALRGACLGLAGRGTGRHSRPQAAFPRAPPRANARGGGACAASARGGLNCGPPQGQGRRPQGAARLGRWKRRGPRPRYAGRRVRRQSRAARPAPQAWPCWRGWPERRRPGRRRGRPHSPHTVGAGPRRSTDAATGEGEEQSKARRRRLALALLCGRVPPSNGGGQLARDAPQARPWPPHFPGQTPQGAGRGGRRHRRRTGWAGCRPAGRRGGWDAAHRRGRGREPLPPGRYPAEKTKRGSAHRALPLVA